MYKQNLFALFFLALVFFAPNLASAENCDDLLVAARDARERYIQDDLARQNETTLTPPESITKALSCFDSFTKSMDFSKYDPSSIMSILENLGDSIGEQACEAAKGYLDSNLSQMSSAANSAGQLPYGLGSLYDTRLSTSGVSVTGNTPSTGSVTSNLPSTSSLPKVPLPF